MALYNSVEFYTGFTGDGTTTDLTIDWSAEISRSTTVGSQLTPVSIASFGLYASDSSTAPTVTVSHNGSVASYTFSSAPTAGLLYQINTFFNFIP